MREAIWEIREGDNRIHLLEMEENSVDSVVTDPPYGLTSIQKRFGGKDSAECQKGTDGALKRLSKGFMGSEWDGTGIERDSEFWAMVLRVLKPGGFLVAFGGCRTYHRMACAIEDAGFTCREMIAAWLYGSGFSKNHVWDAPTGREREKGLPQVTEDDRMMAAGFEGWGKPGLKPAQEPIGVFQKPISESSYAENVLRWGTGGMNITGCRVGNEAITTWGGNYNGLSESSTFRYSERPKKLHDGRFPPNLLLSHHPDCIPAGTIKTAGQPKSSIVSRTKSQVKFLNSSESYMHDYGGEEIEVWRCHESCWCRELERQSPGASRFFPQFGYEEDDFLPFLYCAKPGTREKEYGLESLQTGIRHRVNPSGMARDPRWGPIERKCIHPCVKPTSLMGWLCRLTTPPSGTVLDPFAGSGSTGVAALQEGFNFIGIEADPVFAEIARERLRNRPRSLFESEAL